jgi:UDP-N-acetylglucosamine 4,6-dehydratase
VSLNNRVVLITGGTGSFGKKFVEVVLQEYKPRKLVIFSRDELKQFEMAQRFKPEDHPCLRYFIGDVRDLQRLERAFNGVDIIVHAAALKQVPTAEYNPIEAIKTNINGAENVINAAINCGIKKVVALSTDKAANPVNLYGATKLCADKLFIAANALSGEKGTRFSVVRYGNVLGSRGSVIPMFLKQRAAGVLTLTDERMTRFWITVEQGVQFVIRCIGLMEGGEMFIPKLPSMKITDLARVIGPQCKQEIIGIRPGEKLHETLITEHDSRHTLEFEDYYIVEPDFHWWTSREPLKEKGAKLCPDGFTYASNRNNMWLGADELRKMVKEMEKEGF